MLQRLHDLRLLFGGHLPQGYRAVKAALVGIGNVKIVFQPCPTRGIPVKHGDTGGTRIDPAVESAVPVLHFQNGCGVRALGMYQYLLLEVQLIIPAGGAQERRPPVPTGQCGQFLPVNLCDFLKSACHGPSYRSLGFSRSFFGRYLSIYVCIVQGSPV